MFIQPYPKMKLTIDTTALTPWKHSLSSYPSIISSLNKPELLPLDTFYTTQLPSLLQSRTPTSYITLSDLSKIMQWKLNRGKWRPRLLSFIKSLSEEDVKLASEKAFKALPDVGKAVGELTVLKGVGPATASAVLAAYAPEVVGFMSDEAMEGAIGNAKEYTLKQCLVFVDKLQKKSKELTAAGGDLFTPSDVERALWCAAIGTKLKVSPEKSTEVKLSKPKGKRKR